MGDICGITAKQVDPRIAEFAALLHVNGTSIESGTCRLLHLEVASDAGLISGKYLFESGDVLYSKLRPYLRKVAVAENRGVCSADMYPIRVRRELVDPKFLAWLLVTDEFTRYAIEESARARMPKLNREQLFAWETALPPIDEQRRILVALEGQMTAVERARAAAEAQLEAARALPSAYVRTVFTGEVAARWTIRALGEVCEGDGQYGTSVKSNGAKEGVAILGMGNILDSQIVWDRVRHVVLPEREVRKYRLEPGDLLFNRTNSAELVGKTAVFRGEREAVFASHLIRFKPRRNVIVPEFLCAFVHSEIGREFVRRHMTRAIGQVNISASTMHRMPVPVPGIAEQEHIVASLHRQFEAARGVETAVERQLTDIEALPPALLRRAFSGEL